jgi:hypothetical protein
MKQVEKIKAGIGRSGTLDFQELAIRGPAVARQVWVVMSGLRVIPDGLEVQKDVTPF